MLDSRLKKLRTALLILVALLPLCAHAQQATTAPDKPQEAQRASDEGDAERAEELYRRGEGLARRGDTRGALEALQEAVKLYLRVYAESKPPGPPDPEVFARFRAEMSKRLAHAPESVELYERLGGADGASAFEREQLDALRAHAQGFVESDASRAIFLGQEADVRAVIRYKPEPGFTEEARQKNVSGTVRLRAVLSADGELRHILVLKGLPSGLTEKCVEAARRTKFTPAVKSGRPVSQFIVLEYNFNTY
jgi:TonB family protein